ncbi:MAG: hypothetical protein O9253_02730, partial [Aquidulcibacter sp.]|nr:hypothetical protein [Aquidulcibacter sp.]
RPALCLGLSHDLSDLVSSSFVPHYDETKSLLNSQPHFCAIGADGEQRGLLRLSHATRPVSGRIQKLDFDAGRFRHQRVAMKLSSFGPSYLPVRVSNIRHRPIREWSSTLFSLKGAFDTSWAVLCTLWSGTTPSG